MSDEIILPDELIISKIYFIRNQKVMIDRALSGKEYKTKGTS